MLVDRLYRALEDGYGWLVSEPESLREEDDGHDHEESAGVRTEDASHEALMSRHEGREGVERLEPCDLSLGPRELFPVGLASLWNRLFRPTHRGGDLSSQLQEVKVEEHATLLSCCLSGLSQSDSSVVKPPHDEHERAEQPAHSYATQELKDPVLTTLLCRDFVELFEVQFQPFKVRSILVFHGLSPSFVVRVGG